MRKVLLAIALLVLVTACGNKSSNQKTLLDSSGNINNVSVIVDNDMWEGMVGEAIRGVLATPVDGLPQDEPLFDMSQIPSNVFSGFVTISRAILKIEMNKPKGLAIAKNVYAKPQKVVIISGQTNQDIINEVTENSAKIINAFKSGELIEKQRRINKSLHHNTSIQEKLGLSIKFPSVYRIAKETDKFFWIRRNITTGTLNIILYDLPYNALKRNDSMANQVIKIRDSINKAYIPGPTENAYMSTENAYTPFHFETILDNKQVLETKGIWDMKNAFMGGPFINYTIDDKINNRWVVIEGFAFAPSVEKRDYMFELEAIIKSIKIN